MKKNFKALKFLAVLALIISSFIACDKEFTNIESDVLGENNANFNKDVETLDITAYNKKLSSVQINGLPANLLGVFNDPAYGKTTASIVSQITPTTFNPDFGVNTVVDSVVLTIPYFSRAVTDSTYTIKDSLYGKADSPFKLSVYQNTYFLRDFDPTSALGNTQRYFSLPDGTVSDGNSVINFEDFKNPTPIFETNEFKPSDKRIRLDSYNTAGELETNYIAPAMRLKLDTNFWKQTIINQQDAGYFANANSFKNYFRGLYIKAEPIGNSGNMMLLNLASTTANIVIYYTKDSTVANERTAGTYTFNFSGNILNTFINDYSIALTDGDTNAGDTSLYLKSTEGSMAVVDLFSGTSIEDFKKAYRQTTATGDYIKGTNGNYLLKRLINDAQLIVFEDTSINTDNTPDYHKFDRIYAYDLKNNQETIDYQIDQISNTQFPVSSKLISLSQRDTIQARYKIRLTEHLNSILLQDSTSTKIGLVISNNVNVTLPSKVLNDNEITGVPVSAVTMPRGTILFGTNNNVPANKKMRLEIFFTEPK